MANVKEAWIKKYGIDEGLRRWEGRKILSACTIESFIKKYGIVTGEEKFLAWKHNTSLSRTLEGYVKKYGKIDGTRKYEKKNSRLSVSVRALKEGGKNEEEIKLIRDTHSKKSKITLETLIEKYGLESGSKKWNQRIHNAKISSKRSLEYWIKKHNGDVSLAKQSLSNYQARDKSFYIEKYGETSGIEKYESAKRKRFLGGFTEPCSRFQKEIEEFISPIQPNIRGHKNPYVLFLKNSDRDILGQSVYIPDMVLLDKKIIIECFGDYWHCNPSIYEKTFIHEVIKKTAEEIQEKDRKKIDYYKSVGYTVIVIWESEWTEEKDFCKQRILNEITQKRNQTKLYS